jgi:hypothetical protein
MARRLTIGEEQEIVSYMRDHPQASVRSVAQRFGRSRPTISDLRRRYALDKPQVPDPSVESGTATGTDSDPLEGINLFEMTEEQFESLVARLGTKP